MFIHHVHAIALDDDQRAFSLELAQLGVRVQVVGDVAAAGGRHVVVGGGHAAGSKGSAHR